MRASSFSLLKTRRFLPLFVAQMLGALNDNMVKNALVVLLLYRAVDNAPALVALAPGAFILPYALFSSLAGQMADRFEKARLIRFNKTFELAIMAVAAAGFVSGNFVLLGLVLVGLGMQAAFFGPLKYGILPDLLSEQELVAGNGLIEAGTFVGILIGTILGGAVILRQGGTEIIAGLGLALALAGLIGAARIPPVKVAASDLKLEWNLWRETMALIGLARETTPVWLSILGLSWFWTIGAILLSEFPVVAQSVLKADGSVVTLQLTLFALGVGTGSVLCARLLNGRLSVRHVPFAALGLSLFTWDFAAHCAAGGAAGLSSIGALLSSPIGWRLSADLFLLALCGGIYSVPLYVILQERSVAECRSRMIACNNVMNAAFMVSGAGVAAGLAALGWSASAILELAAAANLLVSLWIVALLPQPMMQKLRYWYLDCFHGRR